MTASWCRLAAGVLLGASAGVAEAATFVFASVEEGRALLGKRDEFVAQMSPFDRAARLKSAAPVSESQYLAFAGRSVVAWDPAHRARVEAALAALKPKLASLEAALPETVLLVATTGEEEGQAEYTRGHAIVIPRGFFTQDKPLEFVLAHELFHLLTRRDAELREDLYEDIGFTRCDKVALPVSLAPRKITNPDAPVSRHCIEVTWNGEEYRALPVLYADSASYDPKRGGEFFEYLEFRLLLDTSAQASSPAGSVRLVKFDQVGGFFEQAGNNTTYVLHPEEILADNFAQILTGVAPQTPAVHERLRDRLFD